MSCVRTVRTDVCGRGSFVIYSGVASDGAPGDGGPTLIIGAGLALRGHGPVPVPVRVLTGVM